MSDTSNISVPTEITPITSATMTVTGAQLTRWSNDTGPAPLIIDVRSGAEYAAVHIRGSYNVPLPTLAEHTVELAAHLGAADSVILVCGSGIRAEQARRHLVAAGLAGARVLDDGFPGYAAAGGEIVRGRRAWTLERQVRFVAGVLVLLGLTAGRLISSRARLVSGAIGAGLTLSSLTDTCAMGAGLARMPWNRDHVDLHPGDALDRVARRDPEG